MDPLVGKTCPYCQFPLKAGDQVRICSTCRIPHHASCWQENGGCTTFGCHGQATVAGGAVATKKHTPEASCGESCLGAIFVVIAVAVLGPVLLPIVLPLVGVLVAILGAGVVLAAVGNAISGSRRR